MLITARTLSQGEARGEVTVLDEPLSLWGGLDPRTGIIVDCTHPQCGSILGRRILAMRRGRGSSSSSSALVEAARAGGAPVAIILEQPDAILTMGALVAAELYGAMIPVVTVPDAEWHKLRSGDILRVSAGLSQAVIEKLP